MTAWRLPSDCLQTSPPFQQLNDPFLEWKIYMLLRLAAAVRSLKKNESRPVFLDLKTSSNSRKPTKCLTNLFFKIVHSSNIPIWIKNTYNFKFDCFFDRNYARKLLSSDLATKNKNMNVMGNLQELLLKK